MDPHRSHLILYVADQERSTRFYSRVLDRDATLDVPGMTEFTLTTGVVLGLMPVSAVRRLLPDLPDPGTPVRFPRAELYLVVDDPETSHDRACAAGAVELSPVLPRDWGERAGYCLDPDGHVIAFAGAAI